MAVYPDFLLGDWVSVLNENYQAETIGSFGSGIIPPVNIPDLLVSQYLRVLVTTQTGRLTWIQGLRLYQTIDTVLGDFDVVSEHLILLGKPEIIKMIDYPDGYRLRLEFFRWFKDCQVSIHEFIE
jgi:hypothetical protein